MKHSIYRRILSLLLALSMCLSVTATAFAAETVTGQVDVETTAGNYESIDVTITIQQEQNADGSTSVQTDSQAAGVTTDNNMVVDYSGSSNLLYDEDGSVIQGEAESSYTVDDPNSTYHAQGGSEMTVTPVAPEVSVDVPLTDEDDPETEEKENQSSQPQPHLPAR